MVLETTNYTTYTIKYKYPLSIKVETKPKQYCNTILTLAV